MKKRIVALLMAFALVLGLAACGGGGSGATDVTGTTWALSGGSQGSTKVSKADLEAVFGGEMTYTFEKDGKLILALAGVEVEGTWSQDGDKVSMDVQGDTGTMTVKGSTLTIEQDGITVEFTKK
ncbi:hypothetical protein D1159_04180 [Pseudoflavonifractor sp. 524-17]|uniref:hypothetical protein n=1 Tax=Pseudoflavonifractor sp. 524-17 TaxID=2304577 RepID=UPI00137B552E|nr:hypothetical protein [Pseudoflavonifractor sp. 524-17]NCE63797.1 hypothetical protein [Pseudoflavonifractor sp. 524-17]